MEFTEVHLLPFATEPNPFNPHLDILPSAAPSGLPSAAGGETPLELPRFPELLP